MPPAEQAAMFESRLSDSGAASLEQSFRADAQAAGSLGGGQEMFGFGR
jgi:hypothetical protein